MQPFKSNLSNLSDLKLRQVAKECVGTQSDTLLPGLGGGIPGVVEPAHVFAVKTQVEQVDPR